MGLDLGVVGEHQLMQRMAEPQVEEVQPRTTIGRSGESGHNEIYIYMRDASNQICDICLYDYICIYMQLYVFIYICIYTS